MLRATKERLSVELKEKEVLLLKWQEKYRTLLEELEDPVFSARLNGPIIEVNPAGVRLFGYESMGEMLQADPTHDLYLNPEDRLKFERLLVEKGRAKDVEIALRRRNGDRITVLASASVIRDEDGKGMVYRGIFKDVTEKKNLEQQLLQSQKMEAIGVMAGGIAHEFNNLLTVILGNAQLALSGLERSHPHHGILSSIQDEGKKAAAIIRRLLGFSRRQALQRKAIHPSEQINNLSRMLSRLIGEDIELRIEFGRDLGYVYMDEASLDHVIINLVVNAREAMPQGGVLTIQDQNISLDGSFCRMYPFVKPGNYVQISTIDTGVGMEESVLQRIFEPFFTTKEGGTGLGLAIVYGIVKQHKGYILVSSQAGKGSRFDIYFPRHLEPVFHVDAEVPLGPVLRGTETLLMAEDEPEIRNMFKIYLEGLGYKVLLAQDGEEALRIFSDPQNRIDLVILDAVMPKLSGPKVYAQMRAVRPTLPCMLLTGYTEEMVKKHSQEGLEIPMLQKPVAFEEFGRKIREILDHPSG